jgi:hypothetical protein
LRTVSSCEHVAFIRRLLKICMLFDWNPRGWNISRE